VCYLTSENELRKVCLELMRAAHPAYLSTVDERGYPQTRALFNLRNMKRYPKLIPLFASHDDDFMILFTTNTSAPKMNDLRKCKHVSVYYCEPENSRGVMFGGDIEIVMDMDIKKEIWHEGWERYYLKGYDDPDHTVLRLYPTMAKGWNQSHTFRFDIK
jgi:general stress protein 26